MTAILRDDPPELAGSRPDLSPALDRIVRHCLEKNPAERFQSARDVAFALESFSGSATASGAISAVGPTASLRRKTLITGAACLVAGLVTGGGLVWQWHESRSSPGPGVTTAFTIDPPTDGAVSNGDPALPRSVVAVSPDGTRVAYTVSVGNIRRLYLRSLDSLTSRPLEGVDNAIFPFWSPDSRELAFLQDGKLKRMVIDGGTTQVIADFPNPRMPGSWGADGTILFVPDYRGPLMRVSAGGGQATPVLSPGSDPVQEFFSPAWLPDGKHFLVVKWFYRDDPGDQAGVFLGTLGSPDLVPVVSGRVEAAAVADGQLLFIRDGELIAQPFDVATQTLGGQLQTMANHVVAFSAAGGTLAYVSRPNGLVLNHRIAWFGRDGTRLSYSAEPGTYRDPRISPDGRWLAVAQGDSNGLLRVYRYDIARNAGVPATSEGAAEPVWSPTGLELLVASQNLYRYPMRGEPVIVLRRSDLGVSESWDWSRDGTMLLAGLYRDRTLVAIEASDPTRRTVIATGSARRAAFSPDGHWVAYDEVNSSSNRVYVVSFPGPGVRLPVTSVAGFNPRWRSDGRELFFRGDDDQMYAVAVTSVGATLTFGEARPLFKLDHFAVGNFAFDVTADGQRFVTIINGGLDRSPVIVRLNRLSSTKAK